MGMTTDTFGELNLPELSMLELALTPVEMLFHPLLVNGWFVPLESEPGKHVSRQIRLQNGKTEQVTLAFEDARDQPENRISAIKQQESSYRLTRPEHDEGRFEFMEPKDVRRRVRRVRRDGFDHFPFRPAVNVVGDRSILDAAKGEIITCHGRDLIFVHDAQAD